MRSRMRSLLLGLAILAGLITASTSQGQGKAEGKTVTFKTYDGVELSGTLYSNPTGKQEAVVLLIPDFDFKKGGGIQKEGWDSLAKDLHKAGFTVFGFDFRGFGDSKSVDPAVFWKQQYNLSNVTRRKVKDKIDHKDFKNSYLPYLVNDIAAAKAFLDRENDRKRCNTSNLIVIGAGPGAGLGAMWLANECRRRKDKNPREIGGVFMPGDPEIRNVAGAIWLSLPHSVGGKAVGSWIVEAGKTHKVPMAFVHGQDDAAGVTTASNMTKYIKVNSKPKDFELTGAKGFKTKLTGHNLLSNALGTDDWIRDKFLTPLMEKRGAKEWIERKVETNRFCYATVDGRFVKINKQKGVEVPPVDVPLLLLR